MQRCILMLLGAALLNGCATGYHSVKDPLLGWTGGFWEEPGPGELVVVGFGGNGYIAHEKVAVYLLYRCAELSREKGKPYFRIYDSLPSAILDRPLNSAFVSPVTGKPLGQVYMLYEDRPVAGAFATAEVISRYEMEVKGGQGS